MIHDSSKNPALFLIQFACVECFKETKYLNINNICLPATLIYWVGLREDWLPRLQNPGMKHCGVNPWLWHQGLAAGDSWYHFFWKVGSKRALIFANNWKIITPDEKDLIGFIYGMGKILITEWTLSPPSPGPLCSSIQPFPGASQDAHTPLCLPLGFPFPWHICMGRQWLKSKCSLQSSCFAEASIPSHQRHEYIWVDPAVFEDHSWRKLWWANPWERADCCRIKEAIQGLKN